MIRSACGPSEGPAQGGTRVGVAVPEGSAAKQRPRARASGSGAPRAAIADERYPRPPKKTNRIGLDHTPVSRRQDDALRGVRTQRDLRAHHRRLLRDGHRSEGSHQAVGHRLFEQEPGVLPRHLSRLQQRARPDAVGRDRRGAGQPQADRHRRQRRRRHRRDRHRSVRAPDAPQCADRLHHRGQRLLRADEGAVLADCRRRLEAEDRCRQRPDRRSIRARWRSSLARRSWRARFPATRSSCCRS